MENKIKINPNSTYTKSAYHKTKGISRPTIDAMIKDKRLKTLNINGATLIID